MRIRRLLAGTALATVVVASAVNPAVSAAPSTRPSPGKIEVSRLSQGARSWFLGPQTGSVEPRLRAARIALGTNVDANDPNKDLAAGQSETAIAASGSTVVVAWNDATGILVQPSTQQWASVTGVSISSDGGRTFRDLTGLRNNKPNQQWFGDPTVVAIDPHHFLIGSLYFPSLALNCSAGPARLQLAVEMLTLTPHGVTLGLPIVTADGGDLCPLLNDSEKDDPPNLAVPDKEWLSYDKVTRTVVMSYTRFFFGVGGQSGNGQIELVRAHVPTDPRGLTKASWSRRITVWPEEATVVNQGSYVSVARNGDAYVAWERNVDSNLFNGNPYVFIHAARVRLSNTTPTVGGPARPRVVSMGQRNSNGNGGVKSLDAVPIAGFNRGTGQDFPRIAVDAPLGKVIVVWNDASAHPLGDVWLRAVPLNLDITGSIKKVNDDNSFALHFLPAVSIRSDGSIATSWYDRRIGGANSTRTDYFGEVRATPTVGRPDFRITTGSTDWTNTSSFIAPNFGDYTDNTSSGKTTYYTWSDGRLGVPQPFVDRR